MFLAIILYCSVPSDTTSCDVMLRKNYLYENHAICKEELLEVAEGLLKTGHYVKARCFPFNPYGSEV